MGHPPFFALEAGFQYDFLLEDLVRSAKAKLFG